MARPQKALVVDDLALNRLILGTILQKLGFEVLEAENGLQCIDVVNQERTQLVCVFLDLQMPVADGWTATRGIRELESRTGNRDDLPVPVVVCTASCLDDLVDDGQTVAQRAVSLGANGAVRKPLTIYAVQNILDTYAPHWRSAREQAGLTSPTAAATATATLAGNSFTHIATTANAASSTPRGALGGSGHTPNSLRPWYGLQCPSQIQLKQRTFALPSGESPADDFRGLVVGGSEFESESTFGCSAGGLSRSWSAEPHGSGPSRVRHEREREWQPTGSGGALHLCLQPPQQQQEQLTVQRRTSYDVSCFPPSPSSLGVVLPRSTALGVSPSWISPQGGPAPALMAVLPLSVMAAAAQ